MEKKFSPQQINIFNAQEDGTGDFTFIDLFAGIGGIRRPFDKLGGRCVFSSEIDKYAIQTYFANYGEMPSGDITKIDERTIPKFDILLAGFPCQAFSIAGKRQGFNDTRGTMFFEIQRILEYHKPKCFLLENVKGLLNHNKGETFKTILDILENKLNYSVFYKVLNAKNFGMPQNRERVIIVGFLDHKVNFEFPEPTGIVTRVWDILEDEVDKKYTISDKLWLSHQRRKEENKKKGNGFGYCLFDENSEYTSTLSARYYKDGSEILIKQEGANPRKITPREAARLQGFPDDFKLVCSDAQSYKQFGNSVPTKMIEAVAINLVKSLKEGEETVCKKQKIEIGSNTYSNNLDFYTMLKLLVQCKLTERQLIYMQKTVFENKNKIVEDTSLLKTLLVDSEALCKSESQKFEFLNYFFNTVDTMDAKAWCEFLDVCIELILVKDLILQESKVFAANEYKKEIKNISDLLSVEYDMSSIHLPYGQRVVGSLLVFAFTDKSRKNDLLLKSSETTVRNISTKISKLSKNYDLNVNSMFQIIMDESMNQSIKSDAGSSYESRVASSLAPIVQKLNGHSHDSKIPSVEYDNTFNYNNKYCGVSSKRTLRERYKQNFEDVDLLDVDYMFVFTLGTDLNEDKLKNITQKKGIYIVVSQEEYNARKFLNTNNRVISSSNIKTAFKNIII